MHLFGYSRTPANGWNADGALADRIWICRDYKSLHLVGTRRDDFPSKLFRFPAVSLHRLRHNHGQHFQPKAPLCGAPPKRSGGGYRPLAISPLIYACPLGYRRAGDGRFAVSIGRVRYRYEPVYSWNGVDVKVLYFSYRVHIHSVNTKNTAPAHPHMTDNRSKS